VVLHRLNFIKKGMIGRARKGVTSSVSERKDAQSSR